MTAQNVLSQAMQLFAPGNKQSSLSKISTGGSGFGKLMDESLMSQPHIGVKASESRAPAQPKQFATKPVNGKTEIAAVMKEGKTELKEPEKLLTEALKKVEGQVKELVLKELGLTDDELEAAMAALGLQMLDLLVPVNMKALVLEVNGSSDAMDLLTNEEMNSRLGNLLDGAEDILSKLGLLENPEELKEMLQTFKEEFDGRTKDLAANGQTDQAVMLESEDKKAGQTDMLEGLPVSEKGAAEENPDEMKADKTAEETITVKVVKEGTASRETDSQTAGGKKEQDDIIAPGREKTESTPLETLIQNLSSSQVSPDKMNLNAAQKLEAMREIVNQVLDQIKVLVKQDSTSMELVLTPESLGKINLSVVAKDGHLTASFTAQNQVTKEALESQMQVLKENLSQQGIKVDAIEVNIQSFAFDEKNQMGNGQKGQEQKKSKEKGLTADDISGYFSEEERNDVPNTADITQSGGNVDYTA